MTNIENLTTYAQEGVETLVKANNAAAKGFETMLKHFATTAGRSFEDAVAATKKLTAAKTPVDFVQVQTKLAEEAFGSFVAEAKTVSEMTGEILKDVSAPLSTLFKASVGVATKAATPTKKAA